MKNYYILLICIICSTLLLTGCSNISKEDKKTYNEFFNKLEKKKVALYMKEESVHFDYDINKFEYYISEDDEEYMLFYCGYSDYFIAYNITKNRMISAQKENVERYCVLENDENSELVNENIDCKDEEDDVESGFMAYCLRSFFEDNKVTREDLITSLRVHYKENIKKWK